MRIAMMTNNYKPFVGGVPISIERLADSLRDLGHSVYVFAPDYKSPVDDDEYTFRFPTMKHKIAGAIPIPNLIYLKEIIELLGLSEKLNNLPNTLSGGQQQRVAIARALATKPAIVLADEPTGNLDSKTSDEVMALLKTSAMKYEQTLIVITHNEDIAQMGNRKLVITDGKVVEQ